MDFLSPRSAFVLSLLLLLLSARSHSSNVVLIRSVGASLTEQRKLEVVTQFYGLNLKVIAVGSDSAVFSSDVRQDTTLAVAVEANALALVNQRELLRALHRRSGESVPLLILGITSDTDPSLLRAWSGGAVIGCGRLEGLRRLQYAVGAVSGITQQLTDLDLSFPAHETFYLALGEYRQVQIIAAVRDDHPVPVFIESNLHQQPVFLASQTGSYDGMPERNAENLVSAFTEVAPEMMFVKHSAGERGWHALHHYANLTIDDPWLREPYGQLDYRGLLAEMEKHNFHTTIAFIPWNYDRSQPDVVSLVRGHPERFSICIHGNNHDHKEFTDLRSKPLAVQVADLKQSLARMEKFQLLTGIPYDSVFVFPHSIGSEKVLEELKAYNFLATINSSNVPMDSPRPASLLFALRPVTLGFANFPSIMRYPADMPSPNVFIRINEFLDNPLFFYTHHDFFTSGMKAFDGLADEVNNIEPGIRWRSVGDIVKHLYLVRLNNDSNYDVLAVSSNLQLENPTARDLVFHVRRQDTGSPAIASVAADGQQYPFQLNNGYLDFNVPIRAGEARNVVIKYQNDLDVAAIDTSKNSLRVHLLRTISDYRDITLSRYTVGRSFIDIYNKNEVMPFLVLGFGLVIAGILALWKMVAILRQRNSGTSVQIFTARSNQ
jgi:hypothetical protein